VADLQAQDSLSGPLPGRARALRLTLICVPLIYLILSAFFSAQSVEVRQELFPDYSTAYLFIHAILYRLMLMGFSLWAAHKIKPIKYLKIKLLKWVLVLLAIAAPLSSLYYDHPSFGDRFAYFFQGGAKWTMTFVAWVIGHFTLAALSLFAASKIGRSPAPPGAAAALRAGLIILPLAGLVFTLIATGLYRLDVEYRQHLGLLMGDFQSLLVPLVFVALGLWAAHQIKPIGALDVQVLKGPLIVLAIALPALAAVNQISIYGKFIVDGYEFFEGERRSKWLSYLLDDDVLMYYLSCLHGWLDGLVYSPMCLFVAYKIGAAKPGADANTGSDRGRLR